MSSPVALSPVYAMALPNDPIHLYSGEATITIEHAGSASGTARVVLGWGSAPAVTFEWEMPADPNTQLRPGPVQLELVDRQFTAIGYAPSVATTLASVATGVTRVRGDLYRSVRETRTGLMSAIFHVPNFISYPGTLIMAPTETGSRSWMGRVEAAFGGWHLTLDDLSASHSSKAAAPGGFLITHVGQLNRENGESFSGSELEGVLRFLSYALSFARGLWSPPVLTVATGIDGSVAWEEWHAPTIDEWKNRMGWFSKDADASDLASYLACFWSRWTDTALKSSIELAVSWYLEANRQGVAQPGIAIEQIGLELLSWLTAVRDRGLISVAGFERLQAHDQLRLLLGLARIDTTYPPTLRNLAALGAAESIDPPEAFTRARNRIVHPPTRSGAPSTEVLIDAYQLGLWYLELVILHYLGYAGKYMNRLARFTTHYVPWK